MSGAGGADTGDDRGLLAELGLGPAERLERGSVASWDRRLDGRRRRTPPC
ncbi:MAG: hypothetical protein V2B17_07325 [Chloroflexota bacterium]